MLLKYAVTLTPEVRSHSFAITKPGAPTLYLGADTEEAANRWATVVKEAVEKNNQVKYIRDFQLPRANGRPIPNGLYLIGDPNLDTDPFIKLPKLSNIILRPDAAN